MAKKPENWYKQSGIIPFKICKGKLEILLIGSRKNKRWIIPKGIVDEGLAPKESALKEAYEEAGIKGEIVTENMWEFAYNKWDGLCYVKVFLMKVSNQLDEWPEIFRKRKWFSIKSAVEKVDNPDLKEIILMAGNELKYIE
jgi:8-oxo-dGTP pyrophosphatase MutT (NUDIX family)